VRTRRPCYFLAIWIAITVGCNHPEEKFGRTWYLDGAGNWGFGVGEAVYGLRKAGYKGQVSSFHWSLTMSPVADQILKPLSGLGSARLAGCITDYLKRYPNNEVNIIGLSAGAGVAIRAVEHLKPPCKINNIILLAASVSCQYDVRPALKNMRGKIYVYYSPDDAMLAGPVRVLGAFGGGLGDDPAGLCGLHAPGAGGRVVNIGWHPRFEQYGWTGSHTSCTSEAFVQHILSSHIVTRATRDTAIARVGRRGSARGPGSVQGTDRRLASAAPEAPPEAHRRSSANRRARDTRRRGAIPPGRTHRDGARPHLRPRTPAKPRPPVFAPPLDRSLATAVQAPVVRPGQPATFLALSRRDPRFPSRSQFPDGLRLRLIGVPSAKAARIELCTGRRRAPAVCDMTVETGQWYRGANGHSWAITLLSVDPPSQTAWLQIRHGGDTPRRAAGTGDRRSPTT